MLTPVWYEVVIGHNVAYTLCSFLLTIMYERIHYAPSASTSVYIGIVALKTAAVYIAILYVGPAAAFIAILALKTAVVYIPFYM